MHIRSPKYLIVIFSLVLYGLMWPGSTLSNIDSIALEPIAPSKNEQQPPELTVSPTYENYKNTARGLRGILNSYYEDTEVVQQERAFKRVIGWKADFENIADKYHHVNWKMLSAIIKAETQGQTGWQESSAKAVGISQIKYQGAWAFLWDALFRQEIKSDSGYVKDYYNANLRVRYQNQLQQIHQYLEENRILVKPTDRTETAYSNARYVSWNHFKAHLRKKYKPGEYQVAVDIAAMYIDHIIMTLHKVKHQVVKIKAYVEKNDFDRLSEIQLSGPTKTRWDRIKFKLLNQKGELNFRQATLDRLNHIQNRLEDPIIYSAAYNFGISKCLEYMESGMKLPNGISRYVKMVSSYHAIFSEIETYRLNT